MSNNARNMYNNDDLPYIASSRRSSIRTADEQKGPMEREMSSRASTSARSKPGEAAEPSTMERLQVDEEAASDSAAMALPRVDGGWGAWSYLAAATVLETLVWGFASSYGVFLDKYDSLFPRSTTLLPVIGTIAMASGFTIFRTRTADLIYSEQGMMYLLLSPLTLWLTSRPHQRTPVMWAGLTIMTAGFLGAAFSKSAAGLVATQGVLYGLGGTMLYCPTTNYLFDWWSRKRGLATGIMFAGTGAGGLVMPLISAALLRKYGQRTTLLSIGVGYAILLGSVIPFIRPRLPLPPRTAPKRTKPILDWGFLRRPAFWLLWSGVLFQGLAAFVPSTYLPSYASALSLSPTIGTLSLSLMNLARVPGQVIIGHLSDKMGPRKLIIMMAVASTVTVFAGWGAALNTGGLVGFALAFGAFAGSYTALFPQFIRIISHDDPHLPAILYALFSLARGVGSIASGPVSSVLMASAQMPGAARGYGVEGYGVLIVWTGVGMALSAVGAGYKGFKVD